jgi:hypothetical protein
MWNRARASGFAYGYAVTSGLGREIRGCENRKGAKAAKEALRESLE